ncbi:MAG TPA: septal ring lytic transglycosylase RlpA family protein, partial [Acidimicrobiales bacterium]|nr:septal ring lytic transglycosylase RlpA family protein [Acidimicrobiales bacterium]
DAFISGGRPGNSLALLAPSPVPRYYTDVVLRRQQDFLTTLHKDESQATLDEKTAVEDYKALDTLNSQLDQERKVLEDRASSDAALALQQQTNLARGIALQQQQQADQQAVNAAAQNGSSLQAGSSFSATESQQTLMGKYPFGPLSTAQLSQYGLVETGQTISGVASWYGPGFDGRPTASGAIYDENGWTCASPDLPFGTLLLVTSGSAGVLVEVNDRGPYADGRVLDLTHAAALAIGSTGLADVVAYVIAPG